jgi:hypothetical protein
VTGQPRSAFAFLRVRFDCFLLERPVYALQRYGVIGQKKILWGVGLLLWFGPKGTEFLKSLLEKFAG